MVKNALLDTYIESLTRYLGKSVVVVMNIGTNINGTLREIHASNLHIILETETNKIAIPSTSYTYIVLLQK